MNRCKEGNDYGRLMILIGILVMVPLAVLPFDPQDSIYAMSFVLPGLLSLITGGFICLALPADNRNEISRTIRQWKSTKTVLFTWVWGILIGALPFVISGQLDMIPALFESVSGWTTTGLSVMDVTVTPQIFLFDRSFMQYCGGMGFIMMIVMLVSDRDSMELFNAEGHPDQLMPSLGKTARTVFLMYMCFLLCGTIAYVLAGMSVSDGINHAMCSLSTGGFSTKLNSIGEYDSIAVELVTVVLMLLGTTNFAVLLLVVKGKWRRVFRVSEVRFMFVVLGVSVVLTGLSLLQVMAPVQAFRHAFFNVTSALSTTGYATMSYELWPSAAKGILIILMLMGGGLGSTAGGIKLTRVYLLLRLIRQNIRRKLLPGRHVETLSYYRAQGKTRIDMDTWMDSIGFVGCYLMVYIIGTLALTTVSQCSLEQAMFEFASALGTVGLSISLTGPGTGSAVLLIEMVGMILGRLEIFAVTTGVFGFCRRVEETVHCIQKNIKSRENRKNIRKSR